MIATLSDDNSSYGEDEEEQDANLCFMVNVDKDQEDEIEYESSDEVDFSHFLSFSKDKYPKP